MSPPIKRLDRSNPDQGASTIKIPHIPKTRRTMDCRVGLFRCFWAPYMFANAQTALMMSGDSLWIAKQN